MKIDCRRETSFTDTLALILSKSTDSEEVTRMPFLVHLLRLNSAPIGSTTGKGCHNNIFLRTNTSWLCMDTCKDSLNSLFCNLVIASTPENKIFSLL